MNSRCKSCILLMAAVAIVICGMMWNIIHVQPFNEATGPPAVVIMSTDMAIEAIKTRTSAIRQRQERLPEVVKNVRKDARSNIDVLRDDALADAWNTRIEQYRRDSSAAAGL